MFSTYTQGGFSIDLRYSPWQKKKVRTILVNAPVRQTSHGILSAALAIANPLDRIELSGGTYAECVAVAQSVELVGADGENVVFSANGPSITVARDGVVVYLSNLTLRSRSRNVGDAAVVLAAGETRLLRCTLNSVLLAGNGIAHFDSCTIRHSAHGYGLRVRGRGAGTMKSCTLHSHRIACASIDTRGRFVLEDSTLYNNRYMVATTRESDDRTATKSSFLSSHGGAGDSSSVTETLASRGVQRWGDVLVIRASSRKAAGNSEAVSCTPKDRTGQECVGSGAGRAMDRTAGTGQKIVSLDQSSSIAVGGHGNVCEASYRDEYVHARGVLVQRCQLFVQRTHRSRRTSCRGSSGIHSHSDTDTSECSDGGTASHEVNNSSSSGTKHCGHGARRRSSSSSATGHERTNARETPDQNARWRRHIHEVNEDGARDDTNHSRLAGSVSRTYMTGQYADREFSGGCRYCCIVIGSYASPTLRHNHLVEGETGIWLDSHHDAVMQDNRITHQRLCGMWVVCARDGEDMAVRTALSLCDMTNGATMAPDGGEESAVNVIEHCMVGIEVHGEDARPEPYNNYTSSRNSSRRLDSSGDVKDCIHEMGSQGLVTSCTSNTRVLSLGCKGVRRGRTRPFYWAPVQSSDEGAAGDVNTPGSSGTVEPEQKMAGMSSPTKDSVRVSLAAQSSVGSRDVQETAKRKYRMSIRPVYDTRATNTTTEASALDTPSSVAEAAGKISLPSSLSDTDVHAVNDAGQVSFQVRCCRGCRTENDRLIVDGVHTRSLPAMRATLVQLSCHLLTHVPPSRVLYSADKEGFMSYTPGWAVLRAAHAHSCHTYTQDKRTSAMSAPSRNVAADTCAASHVPHMKLAEAARWWHAHEWNRSSAAETTQTNNHNSNTNPNDSSNCNNNICASSDNNRPVIHELRCQLAYMLGDRGLLSHGASSAGVHATTTNTSASRAIAHAASAGPALRHIRLSHCRVCAIRFASGTFGLVESCDFVRCGPCGVMVEGNAHPIIAHCRFTHTGTRLSMYGMPSKCTGSVGNGAHGKHACAGEPERREQHGSSDGANSVCDGAAIWVTDVGNPCVWGNALLAGSGDGIVLTRAARGVFLGNVLHGNTGVGFRVGPACDVCITSTHEHEEKVQRDESAHPVTNSALVHSSASICRRYSSLAETDAYSKKMTAKSQRSGDDGCVTDAANAHSMQCTYPSQSAVVAQIAGNRIMNNGGGAVWVGPGARPVVLFNDCVGNASSSLWSKVFSSSGGGYNMHTNSVNRSDGSHTNNGAHDYGTSWGCDDNGRAQICCVDDGGTCLAGNTLRSGGGAAIGLRRCSRAQVLYNSITHHADGVVVELDADPIVRGNALTHISHRAIRCCNNALGSFSENELHSDGAVCVEVCEGSEPIFRDNVIAVMSAQAVGLWVDQEGGGLYECNEFDDIACTRTELPSLHSTTARANVARGVHACPAADVVVLDCGTQPCLRNNTFCATGPNARQCGVVCARGSAPVLLHNTLMHHRLCGVYIIDAATPVLRYNRIGETWMGVLVRDAGAGEVSYNTVHHCRGAGVVLGDGARARVCHNHVNECACDGTHESGSAGNGAGVWVLAGAAGVVCENVICDNAVGVMLGAPSSPSSSVQSGLVIPELPTQCCREKGTVAPVQRVGGDAGEGVVADGVCSAPLANSRSHNTRREMRLRDELNASLTAHLMYSESLHRRSVGAIHSSNTNSEVNNDVDDTRETRGARSRENGLRESTHMLVAVCANGNNGSCRLPRQQQQGGEAGVLDVACAVVLDNAVYHNRVAGVQVWLQRFSHCGVARVVGNDIYDNGHCGVWVIAGMESEDTVARTGGAREDILLLQAVVLHSNCVHSHTGANIWTTDEATPAPAPMRTCQQQPPRQKYHRYSGTAQSSAAPSLSAASTPNEAVSRGVHVIHNDLYDAPVGVHISGSTQLHSLGHNDIHHCRDGIRVEGGGVLCAADGNDVHHCAAVGLHLGNGSEVQMHGRHNRLRECGLSGVWAEQGSAGCVAQCTITNSWIGVVVMCTPDLARSEEYSGTRDVCINDRVNNGHSFHRSGSSSSNNKTGCSECTVSWVENEIAHHTIHGVLVLSCPAAPAPTVVLASHAHVSWRHARGGAATGEGRCAAHFLRNRIHHNGVAGVCHEKLQADATRVDEKEERHRMRGTSVLYDSHTHLAHRASYQLTWKENVIAHNPWGVVVGPDCHPLFWSSAVTHSSLAGVLLRADSAAMMCACHIYDNTLGVYAAAGAMGWVRGGAIYRNNGVPVRGEDIHDTDSDRADGRNGRDRGYPTHPMACGRTSRRCSTKDMSQLELSHPTVGDVHTLSEAEEETMWTVYLTRHATRMRRGARAWRALHAAASWWPGPSFVAACPVLTCQDESSSAEQAWGHTCSSPVSSQTPSRSANTMRHSAEGGNDDSRALAHTKMTALSLRSVCVGCDGLGIWLEHGSRTVWHSIPITEHRQAGVLYSAGVEHHYRNIVTTGQNAVHTRKDAARGWRRAGAREGGGRALRQLTGARETWTVSTTTRQASLAHVSVTGRWRGGRDDDGAARSHRARRTHRCNGDAEHGTCNRSPKTPGTRDDDDDETDSSTSTCRSDIRDEDGGGGAVDEDHSVRCAQVVNCDIAKNAGDGVVVELFQRIAAPRNARPPSNANMPNSDAPKRGNNTTRKITNANSDTAGTFTCRDPHHGDRIHRPWRPRRGCRARGNSVAPVLPSASVSKPAPAHSGTDEDDMDVSSPSSVTSLSWFDRPDITDDGDRATDGKGHGWRQNDTADTDDEDTDGRRETAPDLHRRRLYPSLCLRSNRVRDNSVCGIRCHYVVEADETSVGATPAAIVASDTVEGAATALRQCRHVVLTRNDIARNGWTQVRLQSHAVRRMESGVSQTVGRGGHDAGLWCWMQRACRDLGERVGVVLMSHNTIHDHNAANELAKAVGGGCCEMTSPCVPCSFFSSSSSSSSCVQAVAARAAVCVDGEWIATANVFRLQHNTFARMENTAAVGVSHVAATSLTLGPGNCFRDCSCGVMLCVHVGEGPIADPGHLLYRRDDVDGSATTQTRGRSGCGRGAPNRIGDVRIVGNTFTDCPQAAICIGAACAWAEEDDAVATSEPYEWPYVRPAHHHMPGNDACDSGETVHTVLSASSTVWRILVRNNRVTHTTTRRPSVGMTVILPSMSDATVPRGNAPYRWSSRVDPDSFTARGGRLTIAGNTFTQCCVALLLRRAGREEPWWWCGGNDSNPVGDTAKDGPPNVLASALSSSSSASASLLLSTATVPWHRRGPECRDSGGDWRVMVRDNALVDNGMGLLVAPGAAAHVVRNTFTSNRRAGMTLLRAGPGLVVRDCVFVSYETVSTSSLADAETRRASASSGADVSNEVSLSCLSREDGPKADHSGGVAEVFLTNAPSSTAAAAAAAAAAVAAGKGKETSRRMSLWGMDLSPRALGQNAPITKSVEGRRDVVPAGLVVAGWHSGGTVTDSVFSGEGVGLEVVTATVNATCLYDAASEVDQSNTKEREQQTPRREPQARCVSSSLLGEKQQHRQQHDAPPRQRAQLPDAGADDSGAHDMCGWPDDTMGRTVVTLCVRGCVFRQCGTAGVLVHDRTPYFADSGATHAMLWQDAHPVSAMPGVVRVEKCAFVHDEPSAKSSLSSRCSSYEIPHTCASTAAASKALLSRAAARWRSYWLPQHTSVSDRKSSPTCRTRLWPTEHGVDEKEGESMNGNEADSDDGEDESESADASYDRIDVIASALAPLILKGCTCYGSVYALPQSVACWQNNCFISGTATHNRSAQHPSSGHRSTACPDAKHEMGVKHDGDHNDSISRNNRKAWKSDASVHAWEWCDTTTAEDCTHMTDNAQRVPPGAGAPAVRLCAGCCVTIQNNIFARYRHALVARCAAQPQSMPSRAACVQSNTFVHCHTALLVGVDTQSIGTRAVNARCNRKQIAIAGDGDGGGSSSSSRNDGGGDHNGKDEVGVSFTHNRIWYSYGSAIRLLLLMPCTSMHTQRAREPATGLHVAGPRVSVRENEVVYAAVGVRVSCLAPYKMQDLLPPSMAIVCEDGPESMDDSYCFGYHGSFWRQDCCEGGGYHTRSSKHAPCVASVYRGTCATSGTTNHRGDSEQQKQQPCVACHARHEVSEKENHNSCAEANDSHAVKLGASGTTARRARRPLGPRRGHVNQSSPRPSTETGVEVAIPTSAQIACEHNRLTGCARAGVLLTTAPVIPLTLTSNVIRRSRWGVWVKQATTPSCHTPKSMEQTSRACCSETESRVQSAHVTDSRAACDAITAVALPPVLSQNKIFDNETGILLDRSADVAVSMTHNDIFDNADCGVRVCEGYGVNLNSSSSSGELSENRIYSTRDRGALELPLLSRLRCRANVIRNEFSPAHERGTQRQRGVACRRALEAVHRGALLLCEHVMAAHSRAQRMLMTTVGQALWAQRVVGVAATPHAHTRYTKCVQKQVHSVLDEPVNTETPMQKHRATKKCLSSTAPHPPVSACDLQRSASRYTEKVTQQQRRRQRRSTWAYPLSHMHQSGDIDLTCVIPVQTNPAFVHEHNDREGTHEAMTMTVRPKAVSSTTAAMQSSSLCDPVPLTQDSKDSGLQSHVTRVSESKTSKKAPVPLPPLAKCVPTRVGEALAKVLPSVADAQDDDTGSRQISSSATSPSRRLSVSGQLGGAATTTKIAQPLLTREHVSRVLGLLTAESFVDRSEKGKGGKRRKKSVSKT